MGVQPPSAKALVRSADLTSHAPSVLAGMCSLSLLSAAARARGGLKRSLLSQSDPQSVGKVTDKIWHCLFTGIMVRIPVERCHKKHSHYCAAFSSAVATTALNWWPGNSLCPCNLHWGTGHNEKPCWGRWERDRGTDLYDGSEKDFLCVMGQALGWYEAAALCWKQRNNWNCQ